MGLMRKLSAVSLAVAMMAPFALPAPQALAETPPNILVIGEYLLDKGSIDDALTIFRRLISERPGDKGLDRAYLGAGRALIHKPLSKTSAWHYFMAAIDLAQTHRVAEEARSYLKSIERKTEAGG